MEIKDFEENSFLIISNWWGLRSPGFGGYFIKENGQIGKFIDEMDFKLKKRIEDVKIIGNLSPEEVSSFKKYLIEEEKVFITDYKQPMIFDMGTTVNVKIDGQEKEIRNESKMFGNTEDKLYERIVKKIEDLVSKTK